MTDLLDLLAAVSDPVSPLGQDGRDRILDAFRQAARLDGGYVNPNRVRDLLTDSKGELVVRPRQLSATYSSARADGLIVHHDWVVNGDVAGGNAGKPLRRYRWTGGAL